ncbi:MAG: hypothetical protein FJ095_15555 [Deltaproteobacteria bacterium]|nr:hypothetical protein [Deltaproteobacteria bacterium]
MSRPAPRRPLARLVLLVTSLGCGRSDATATPAAERSAVTTTTGSAAVTLSATLPSSISPPSAPLGAASEAATSLASGATPAPAPAPSTSANAKDSTADPPLRDAAGKLLPQTDERPRVDSPLFRRRLHDLVRAIETDDPELARSFFFPVEAYEVVKDIKEPAKDWRQRLFRAFGRHVHEYHRKLGDDAAGTRLVRLELDERRVKWMKPGSEGNLLGYHRITRSKLVVVDGAGKERTFELTSLISWRGEWCVVHLHGFK